MAGGSNDDSRTARGLAPRGAAQRSARGGRGRGILGALLGALACGCGCGEVRPSEPPRSARLSRIRSFVCCYRDDLRPEELKGFDLAIVDGGVKATPEALRGGGRLVLAYLSIGEIAAARPGFAQLRKAGVLVEENPSWPGAWRVDPRAAAWRAHLLAKAEDHWLRGFDGLFLDTADVAGFLEERDPARFRGAVSAMVDLVRALRQRLPEAVIVLNQGLDLYPEVRGAVDAALAEGLFARYDFERKIYGRTPDDAWHRQRLATFTRLAAEGLPVLTIEYARTEDRALGLRAIEAARRHGFLPYVADLDLQSVRRDAAKDDR